MATSKRRAAPKPQAQTIILRERPPGGAGPIFVSSNQIRRGVRGRASSLFASARTGYRARAGRGFMFKETAQGAGGGVASGLLESVLPDSWTIGDSKAGRAAVVFGAGWLLAWALNLPSHVLAGIAGGVARGAYDEITK